MIKKYCYSIIFILLFINGCQGNHPSSTIVVAKETSAPNLSITQIPNTTPTLVSTTEPELFSRFAGRILLATHDANGYSIYTLQEGFTYPVPLWTNLIGELPANFNNQPSKDYPIAVASPDGNWVVLNNILVNLNTGDYKNLVGENTTFIYSAFSPDSRYLIMGIGGFDTQAKLILHNLIDGTQKEVYSSDCQKYSYGSGVDLGNSYTYCGEIDQPMWLDKATIFFPAHRGKMPSCIYCGASDTLAPNSYLIMTTDGEILHEINQKGIVFSKLYRNENYLQKELLIDKFDLITAFEYREGHSPEFIFLSVSSLKEGIFKNESPAFDTNYRWDKVIPSPDTVYLFDPSGKIMNTNTTEEKSLSLFNNCDAGLMWSPESTKLVCLSETKTSLFPMVIYSVDQESPIFSFDLQRLNKEWWNLISWQP